MADKHFTLQQIADELKIKPHRAQSWVDQGLVVPSRDGDSQFFVEEDLERFRVIKNLTDDLEVNEEGVEVILSMRDKMISMERLMKKFFEILDQHHLLTDELMQEFKKF